MSITVQIEPETLDTELQKIRISSADKGLFESTCIQSGVTMSQAIRALIQAVNRGEIVLAKQ